MTQYHLYEDFEKLWNGSATLEEAAFKLGCSKREATNRASAHRRRGRALKEFAQPPKTAAEKLRAPDPQFDKLLATLQGKGELNRHEELLLGEHIARRAKLLRGGA
jgi:hypothetical protein